MTGNRREDQRKLTHERQGSRLDSHRRRQQGRLTQERGEAHTGERGDQGRLTQEREGSREALTGEGSREALTGGRGERGGSHRREKGVGRLSQEREGKQGGSPRRGE